MTVGGRDEGSDMNAFASTRGCLEVESPVAVPNNNTFPFYYLNIYTNQKILSTLPYFAIHTILVHPIIL